MSRSIIGALLGCVLLAGAWETAVAQPRIAPPGGAPAQPSPPPAAEPLLKGTTLAITSAQLKEAGYSDVQVYTASNGAKHVSGRLDATVVSAIHLHCSENGVCPALAFVVNFGRQITIDDNYTHAWNAAKLYARLYKGADGNLFLEQDVLVYDVPPIYIRHAAQMFARLLGELYQFKPPQR